MDMDSPVDPSPDGSAQVMHSDASPSPYRTAPPPPPEPKREPMLHRILFLIGLLMGPPVALAGLDVAFHFMGPPSVLVCAFMLGSYVAVPMGIFDSFGYAARPDTRRGKVAACFWAPAWFTWWLTARLAWPQVSRLGKWIRQGDAP